MQGSLVKFPASVNTPSSQPQRKPPHRVGGPASRMLRSDLVLRQLRQTRNVVTVARRMGVRCNDIALVVLDCLDERRAA